MSKVLKRSLKDFQRSYAACQHDDDNDGDSNYDTVYILLHIYML